MEATADEEDALSDEGVMIIRNMVIAVCIEWVGRGIWIVPKLDGSKLRFLLTCGKRYVIDSLERTQRYGSNAILVRCQQRQCK